MFQGSRSAVVALGLLLPACSDGKLPAAVSPTYNADLSVNNIVATVDGQPIYRHAVSKLAKEHGWQEARALRVLEDQMLLASHAAAFGYRSHDKVRYHRARLWVQALLARAIEQSVTPSKVSRAQLETAYQRQRAKFVKPERRIVSHILAAVNDSDSRNIERKAFRFVEDAINRLNSSSDAGEVLKHYQEIEGQPFRVRAEHLPPLETNSPIVEEFRKAAFRLKAPGVYPRPVRTPYGWHAIYLQEIQEATHVTLEEAAPRLREEIALANRKRSLEALLAQLRKRYAVEIFGSIVRDVLAEDSISKQDG